MVHKDIAPTKKLYAMGYTTKMQHYCVILLQAAETYHLSPLVKITLEVFMVEVMHIFMTMQEMSPNHSQRGT